MVHKSAPSSSRVAHYCSPVVWPSGQIRLLSTSFLAIPLPRTSGREGNACRFSCTPVGPVGPPAGHGGTLTPDTWCIQHEPGNCLTPHHPIASRSLLCHYLLLLLGSSHSPPGEWLAGTELWRCWALHWGCSPHVQSCHYYALCSRGVSPTLELWKPGSEQ